MIFIGCEFIFNCSISFGLLITLKKFTNLLKYFNCMKVYVLQPNKNFLKQNLLSDVSYC